MAKEFLSHQGVDFVQYDVAQDPRAREEMLRLTGRMAVPVIVIDGEVIVGFDQEEIKERLQRGGKG